MSLLANGLIMLCNFIADVAATDGACDYCQSATITTTNVTFHYAAKQGANADAKRTVLSKTSRLPIRGE
ncbi:hypothetical protein [Duganella flavida]|uniref:hypothetical protein n=1 Tax=Duganella flavida TaxID=2692175 RepID=UPI001E28D670|nr:hypothetical protein [Duganella flavida]